MQGLSPAAIASIARDFRVFQVGAGAPVRRDGDDPAGAFLVLTGEVEARTAVGTGRDATVSVFRPGECFGLLSAVGQTAPLLSFKTRQDSDLAWIPCSRLAHWMTQEPALLRNVVGQAARHLRLIDDHLFVQMAHKVEGRLRMELARLFLEAGGLEPGRRLRPAPGHAALAVSIGANREAVSRTMSVFNQSGIIRSGRQWIELLDPQRLTYDLNFPEP